MKRLQFMTRSAPGDMKVVAAVWLAVLLLLLLTGCSRKVYVPVERTVYHTDTLRLASLRVDTVVDRDSVAVYVSGDTVRITRYRDRLRYRDRTDTVYRAVTDTARIEVPVPVERPLTRWQRLKQETGGFALGALALGLAAAVVWLIRRFRSRR